MRSVVTRAVMRRGRGERRKRVLSVRVLVVQQELGKGRKGNSGWQVVALGRGQLLRGVWLRRPPL